MQYDMIVEMMERSPLLEELLRDALARREFGQRLDETDDRLGTDELVDTIRHGPILEELLKGPLDRREIERRVDVSRTTSHRMTRWLDERNLIEKSEGEFSLTGQGEIVAEETLRYERNIQSGRRLAPLLEVICDHHKEFVIEPFADATVTTAEPDDPYRPIERFVSLFRETDTFRGFNTTQMAPLSVEEFHQRIRDEMETELIYLPDVIEKLCSTAPERASEAFESDHLTLRTRDALPYGLAIFDNRVGIGGYDKETGQLRVFVDTDAAIAREWAESVYASFRADSDPLNERADPSRSPTSRSAESISVTRTD